MKLIELLEGIKTVLIGHDQIRAVNICTMEDVVKKMSETKNQYIHCLVVYDQRDVKLGEWSQSIPVSIIFSDKVRADQENKLNVHSNTLSATVESTLLIRNWLASVGCDGFDKSDTIVDVWTDKFGDALLAGTKLDTKIIAELGGFCELIP